jgi:23S rRNA (cytosine1962-C5)-methyltransferase
MADRPEGPSRPRLKLRVTASAEDMLRRGHPWLYADSIREQSREGDAGELAVVYDRRDRFLALGLFDPDSPLRLRVLHRGTPTTLDAAWWRDRFQQALDRRQGYFDDQTTGYRWIHGENDGWPGLVLDRYGTVLTLKLYTVAWLPHLDRITTLVRDVLRPSHLVLRLSRNLESRATEAFGLRDGQLLLGSPLTTTPNFLESGLHFEADVLRGQKTGFFLDQRENRRAVEGLARGRDVLNAFSFSGGFSLYAARGGARSVTDLDISPHALAAGRRNFALNGHLPAVHRCQRTEVQADAMDWLRDPPCPQFDLVILDPPSLARRQAEREGALRTYSRLATSALQHLRRDGILVAASCSAHVSAEAFFATIRQAARDSGRPWRELRTTGHPPDHPATFPEAHYLKCLYLELTSASP